MGDYINRKAFLEHMKHTDRYFGVKFDIENFPAADVAPVVRCVDCLFFRTGENECESWEWCALHGIDMSANAFCSYGKRMDSDEQ